MQCEKLASIGTQLKMVNGRFLFTFSLWKLRSFDKSFNVYACVRVCVDFYGTVLFSFNCWLAFKPLRFVNKTHTHTIMKLLNGSCFLFRSLLFCFNLECISAMTIHLINTHRPTPYAFFFSNEIILWFVVLSFVEPHNDKKNFFR